MATALTLITDFERTLKQGVFTNIKPATVAKGLRERLIAPASIHQGLSSLCGPAVVLFFLARRHPDRYVKYVLDVYQTGRAQLGKLSVEPGSSCRRYTVPSSDIHPVDWIALASLRDSENDFFNYDSISDQVGGITMPGDLADWFRKVGFAQAHDETNLFFNKNEDNLRSASGTFKTGSSVCLFIDSNVLSTATVGDATVFPNHWVGLTSVVNIAWDKVSFTVFTWGAASHRVPTSGTMKMSTFLDHYYGYVWAK